MTPELRAAAERLLDPNNGIGGGYGRDYVDGGYAADDAISVAKALLAEHPTDDDEPVKLDWFSAVCPWPLSASGDCRFYTTPVQNVWFGAVPEAEITLTVWFGGQSELQGVELDIRHPDDEKLICELGFHLSADTKGKMRAFLKTLELPIMEGGAQCE
jgi:hypothetical protein